MRRSRTSTSRKEFEPLSDMQYSCLPSPLHLVLYAEMLFLESIADSVSYHRVLRMRAWVRAPPCRHLKQFICTIFLSPVSSRQR